MDFSPADIVYFYPAGHAAHAEPGHPERPERVESLRQSLVQAGWWDVYPQVTPAQVPQAVLERVHSPAYLRLLQSACSRGSRLDMDTYTTPASWELALESAGGAVAGALQLWQGKARRLFALTRPPGHHASRERGMGFCLVNNIAIAAEALIQLQDADRLAIVDLDLHHGNGTQDIFYTREEVFYISTHQSPYYPGTGGLDETGAAAGAWCNANFPLPPGSGDHAFMEVMDSLILRLLDRYQPQILLVSFGFDPHWRDPLGYLNLSAQAYGALIARLAGWADANCQGRIGLFLEGGYDLLAGAACAQAVVAALLSKPWQDPLGPSPQAEGEAWRTMLSHARQLWGG